MERKLFSEIFCNELEKQRKKGSKEGEIPALKEAQKISGEIKEEEKREQSHYPFIITALLS